MEEPRPTERGRVRSWQALIGVASSRRGAGHGMTLFGQCGRWFALRRGERIGYRPLERGEAGIDLRQRLGRSFQWQFERGLRRFDFDHRRRRQLAHKLSVSAKFDHHQFRADDDVRSRRCAAPAARSTRSERSSAASAPTPGSRGPDDSRPESGQERTAMWLPACGTGQRPLTGAIALAPSDHRPGSDLLRGNDLRVGRWRIDLGRGAGLGRQRERQDGARDEARERSCDGIASR